MSNNFLQFTFVLNLQSRDWGYSGGLLGFNSELAKESVRKGDPYKYTYLIKFPSFGLGLACLSYEILQSFLGMSWARGSDSNTFPQVLKQAVHLSCLIWKMFATKNDINEYWCEGTPTFTVPNCTVFFLKKIIPYIFSWALKFGIEYFAGSTTRNHLKKLKAGRA